GPGAVVAEPDIQDRAVRRRLVQAQQAGDRPRRADLVPDPDDRVVEQDRHRTPPTQRPAYQPAPPADPVHSDDPKKVSTDHVCLMCATPCAGLLNDLARAASAWPTPVGVLPSARIGR